MELGLGYGLGLGLGLGLGYGLGLGLEEETHRRVEQLVLLQRPELGRGQVTRGVDARSDGGRRDEEHEEGAHVDQELLHLACARRELALMQAAGLVRVMGRDRGRGS